jgi:hypothetical protein
MKIIFTCLQFVHNFRAKNKKCHSLLGYGNEKQKKKTVHNRATPHSYPF